MEPLSATGGRVVPKLHLLNAGTDTDNRFSNNAAYGGSVSERLPHRPTRRSLEPSTAGRVGKVMPARVSAASMEFLESPVLPPMKLRPMAGSPQAVVHRLGRHLRPTQLVQARTIETTKLSFTSYTQQSMNSQMNAARTWHVCC